MINASRLLVIAALASTVTGASKAEPAAVADPQWWSLRPIEKPAVPPGDTWCQNEIDRFVLVELHKHGLSPSPEADPRTLIRRLTYDLTGLPPTYEKIRTFSEDYARDSEGTWRHAIEELLSSPRYGEHWARHWLDVARYGESHGYDKDKARFHAWPYRDYVIRSFNGDKSWSRFVQEQVAGDALWPGDPDGIIALGFLAAGPWDYIAHSEVGEQKVDGRIAKHLDRDDMVGAVFNAFMSTTAQCAQCHDHKIDPVSMEDYYRLQSVFAAVDRWDRPYETDPEIARRRAELETEVAKLEEEDKAIGLEIASAGGAELAALKEDIAALETAGAGALRTVPEHGFHSAISASPDEAKWVQIELAERVPISEIRIIGCHDDFAGIGAGFGFPVRYRVEFSDDPDFESGVATLADFTSEDVPNPGVHPTVIDAPDRTVKILRITVERLAERKGDFIFALAEVQILDRDGKNVALNAKVTAKDSIEAPIRWARSNLVDGKFPAAADPDAVAKLAALQDKLGKVLASLETPEIRTRRAYLERKLPSARAELAQIPAGKLVYAIASHFKEAGQVKPTGGRPRPIQVLNRGDIRSPGALVEPGAPALWGTAPVFDLPENHSEGDRRAALAKYLTDPLNPLVWRSAVNRIWLYHMGRGLVETPNDFGKMGSPPSHPELLDWMAAHFRDEAGQSLKAMHRLILSSATYRQSAHRDPHKATKDQGNTYYWRIDRRKLRAEELRDSVLAAAGALDLTMGGPSFQDFQFKDDHTPKFHYHLHDPEDPKSHRRSIYRFIARSQPQPLLTVLDCADPSQMVAKRDETTTALQALSLMNNPFMLAMSKRFAARVAGSDDPISEAIRIAFGRGPGADEHRILTGYAAEHGLAATCRLILNLNEFVYVD